MGRAWQIKLPVISSHRQSKKRSWIQVVASSASLHTTCADVSNSIFKSLIGFIVLRMWEVLVASRTQARPYGAALLRVPGGGTFLCLSKHN